MKRKQAKERRELDEWTQEGAGRGGVGCLPVCLRPGLTRERIRKRRKKRMVKRI